MSVTDIQPFYVFQANGHAMFVVTALSYLLMKLTVASGRAHQRHGSEHVQAPPSPQLCWLRRRCARSLAASVKDMTKLNGQKMDANVVVLGTDNVGKSGKFIFRKNSMIYIHKMHFFLLQSSFVTLTSCRISKCFVFCNCSTYCPIPDS